MDHPRPGHRRPPAVAIAAAAVTGVVLALVVALLPAAPAVGAARPAGIPPEDSRSSRTESPPGPVRVAVPPASGELTPQDVTAWLDGFLPARLEAEGVVGGAVSVVADGRVVASRGYGSATTDGEPVDPERTLFRAGSVTKLVTATAAMQLVQDGRLDLDTDVEAYLDVPVPRRFDEPVTLRHLLTHTAGFEERIVPFISNRPEDLPSLRDVVSRDQPDQIFAPGTVPAYSNYGMTLVGYLVEVVSGQPYDEYVDEHVLGALGMADSTVAQPLPATLAERMSGGWSDGGRTEVPFELIASAPAGSLTTTAQDMTRFMLAHLEGGAPDGAAVLDRATTDLMQTPALGAEDLGTLAGGERMALGFVQEDRNGREILGHGGDTTAFHSHLQIYPEEGAGIFVTLNSTGNGGPAASVTIRDQIVDGFADRYFPDRAEQPPTLDTSAEHAAAAAGSYVSSRRMQSTFLRVLDLGQTTVTPGPEGTLELSTLTAADGTPKRWREVEPWVWQEVGGEDRIAMRVEDGRVETIAFLGAFALTRASVPTIVVLPVLLGAMAVLLLTVLAWPVTALARRTYRATPRPVGTAVRLARLGVRLAAVLVLLALAGWTVVLMTLLGQFVMPPVALLRALQVATATGLVVLVAAAAWRVWTTWRTGTPWRARVWAPVVLLAAAATTWFSHAYGLLSPSVTI